MCVTVSLSNHLFVQDVPALSDRNNCNKENHVTLQVHFCLHFCLLLFVRQLITVERFSNSTCLTLFMCEGNNDKEAMKSQVLENAMSSCVVS